MDFDDDSANASVDVTNLSDLMMIINDATGAFQRHFFGPKGVLHVCVCKGSNDCLQTQGLCSSSC